MRVIFYVLIGLNLSIFGTYLVMLGTGVIGKMRQKEKNMRN